MLRIDAGLNCLVAPRPFYLIVVRRGEQPNMPALTGSCGLGLRLLLGAGRALALRPARFAFRGASPRQSGDTGGFHLEPSAPPRSSVDL